MPGVVLCQTQIRRTNGLYRTEGTTLISISPKQKRPVIEAQHTWGTGNKEPVLARSQENRQNRVRWEPRWISYNPLRSEDGEKRKNKTETEILLSIGFSPAPLWMTVTYLEVLFSASGANPETGGCCTGLGRQLRRGRGLAQPGKKSFDVLFSQILSEHLWWKRHLMADFKFPRRKGVVASRSSP